jgi:catechol 2,3-dioxygenase-like lactoylglutathione lyase family enzyme
VNIDAQITFLPSGNLSLSREFYTEILGLEITVDQGSCLIFRVTNDAFVAVCQRETVESATGVIVTFVTDDVDGWCERILEAGGRIDAGPEHSDRYGIYHAFLSDPDGNLLEIQTFDDPAWASRP